ncbi:MAG: putative NTP binding protein (contains STAS domain) [Candidatus Accumulibacter sp. BA-94]|nr:MAG: putative NTP binding protein (contains STAS domain) [Candidatus Accumulibacter sp. BA-94]
MVFSFFKKQPEKKMGARPAATPRSGDERGSGVADGPPEDKLRHAPAASVGLNRADLPFATPVANRDAQPLDLSEFVFSAMEPNFQPEVELDPIDAEAEEAAMLYANGQDAAVRSRLEHATRLHRSGAGERLWLMLFDLFRVGGQKAPFEALGIEYAQVFEKSPPGWQEAVRAAPVLSKAGSVLFKGDLTGDNEAGFAAVRQALAINRHLRLDLGKVRRLDDAGCERLLAMLQQAHRSRHEIELINRDHVSGLLDRFVVPGQQSDRACWLLKLEFCQLYDQLEVFEELAIQYAVNFEISPPSWEPQRVAATAPCPLVLAADDDLMAEAYVIMGEVKSSRFGDLLAYAAAKDPVLIDCSRVTRMDFLSAGALLNVLTTIKGSGRQIVFRHPNHLVAELFRVVGLRAVAEVVLARN